MMIQPTGRGGFDYSPIKQSQHAHETLGPSQAAMVAGSLAAGALGADQAAPSGQAAARNAARRTGGVEPRALKRMDEVECATCAERKYQDGSNDASVSFQTPQHIAPEAAASAVRAHEQEHVTNEQANAKRDDRKVLSQTVQIHTGVCPECGKIYVAGGTTRTVTKADNNEENRQQGLLTPYRSLAVDARG